MRSGSLGTRIFSRATHRHLNDAAKVRLLLRKLHTTSLNRYLNYILPRLPREVTFSDTVETLKKIFGEQTSLFRRRFQCLQLMKSEGRLKLRFCEPDNRPNRMSGVRHRTEGNQVCRYSKKIAHPNGERETRFQQLVNLKADNNLIEHPTCSKATAHAISEKKIPTDVSKYPFKPEVKSPKTPC